MAGNTESLSTKLANAMSKLYKVGGLILVFTFLGALFTLAGNLFGGPYAGVLVTVGALLTFTCLLLFALPQIPTLSANRKGHAFTDQIVGPWWEGVTPNGATAISWVMIQAQPLTGTVHLRGRAFDLQGAEFATWDSVASCVDADAQNIYYQWTGNLSSEPSKTFEGFGKIRLHGDEHGFETGDGFFFDYLVGATNLVIKSTRLRRCRDPKEVEIMNAGSREARTSLVQKILREF